MAVKAFGTDVVTRQRSPFPARVVFDHYQASALTTGTNEYEWTAPCDLKILDVLVHSGAAGSGGTSTIIDVNKNGTTIFTTQANRPTLLAADSGAYARKPPEVTSIKAGDTIGYDIDQISTTGPTRTKVTIVCGMPG